MTTGDELILSGVVGLMGIAVAGWHGVSTVRSRRTNAATRTGAAYPARPWRRLGAAICGLLGVMCFAGTWLLDATATPRVFAVFWLTVLVLVGWLCALAMVDILHTHRRFADARRRARAQLQACLSTARGEPSSTNVQEPAGSGDRRDHGLWN